MDDIDRQLLIFLQKEIPLQSRPFEVIGRKLGLDSGDVILRINRLRDEKVIRQISAVFEMDKIGYQNVLAAMNVDEASVDTAAGILCRHPGVPVCTKRRGELNLWFVLALPPQESLTEHLRRLEQLTGAQRVVTFRTLKSYKPREGSFASQLDSLMDLKETEIQLVQMLQDDFPLTDEPFRTLAKRVGMTEENYFRQLEIFQKKGFLRRFTAFTAFREKSSESALAMWRVPQEKIDATGEAIASFLEVQLCLERTVTEEFQYPLHAVLEGVSEANIPAVLKKIEEKIGSWPSKVFMNEKDYKRSRLKYFPLDLQEWRMSDSGTVSSAPLE